MKTILIGFDAFDPEFFERLEAQGKVPNLGKLASQGGYARFSIANPAQSEVSWTSIASGLNPGGHGLFDFVHRNPADYSLHVSLLPTRKTALGTQFTPPHSAHTVFDHAVHQGYPATTLWWPATFPAQAASPVHTIPGLGTPDILGRLGVGAFYCLDPSLSGESYKTRIEPLEQVNRKKARGQLKGPFRKGKQDSAEHALASFELDWIDEQQANLKLGKQEVALLKDQWSPFLHVRFKMQLGVSLHAITRALFTDHAFGPAVYFLPLQIHPLHAPWPYANPGGFGKELWKSYGPFHTLGWPQDTTALDEGLIEDGHFLQLCEMILAERERILTSQLANYKEGLLAIVFDSLDRIQHMFWRDRSDIIESWYTKLDALFGRIETQISGMDHEDIRLVVLSDHGFSDFYHKIHLNRWLIEHGYLAPKNEAAEGNLKQVDWSRTRAYAVGLSSIYINLAGREGEGIIPEAERETLLATLKADLESWFGPDQREVVRSVWHRDEVFQGPLAPYGPDLVVGFNSGYRASGQTGLGSWGANAVEPNNDHWGADHCIDPELVDGVLFCNTGLQGLTTPSYTDIPELVTGEALSPQDSTPAPPPTFSEEDREILEERLKDLGYL